MESGATSLLAVSFCTTKYPHLVAARLLLRASRAASAASQNVLQEQRQREHIGDRSKSELTVVKSDLCAWRRNAGGTLRCDRAMQMRASCAVEEKAAHQL